MDEIKEAGMDRQLSSGVVLTGGGSLLGGMTGVAEEVFESPVRIGYPERDRFGGLIEDIQSPAWATAAGLALVAYRSQSLDYRAMAAKKDSTGKLNFFVAKVRQRFSGIF
jgi:cell division protein FtsA